jgi:hypothetical protein
MHIQEPEGLPTLVFSTLRIKNLSKMKTIVIKVIKRKALDGIARALPAGRRRARPMTVSATVNDWIAENRRHRAEKDNSSRETIAGWTAEANI